MSNNIGLISAASLNESAEFTLDEVKSTAQNYLSTIAPSEDFVTKIAIAFGDNFDADPSLLWRFAIIRSHTLTIYFFDVQNLQDLSTNNQ